MTDPSQSPTIFGAFDMIMPQDMLDGQFYWDLDVQPIQSPEAVAEQDCNSTDNSSESTRQPSICPRSSGLACLNCRSKKIKCHQDGNKCKRCRRMKLNCQVPAADERRRQYSKSRIRELESTIMSLNNQLKEQTHVIERLTSTSQVTPSSMLSDLIEIQRDEDSTKTPDFDIELDSVILAEPPGTSDIFDSVTAEEKPKTLMDKICNRDPVLGVGEFGQWQYFGPTSSLHTTEALVSPFAHLGKYMVSDQDTSHDIPQDLEDNLLQLYWKHSHITLPIVHRDAFVQDMQSKRCRYYSRALLYTMLACGAKISSDGNIRSMALQTDMDATSSIPFLVERAMGLVEEELEHNPGITTIQALQLLSVAHCCRGADRKGWMDSGRAIRLLFEMGIHRSLDWMQNERLSAMDREVHRMVLWGCIIFDRAWGLYLGRPYFIKNEDLSLTGILECDNVCSFDILITHAWANLFIITGRICDILNENISPDHGCVTSLHEDLLSWRSNLHPSLSYSPDAKHPVLVLHIQFCVSIIILHKASAQFGTPITDVMSTTLKGRELCVDHAVLLATIASEYTRQVGTAMTMASTGLYNLTIAVTILITDLSDSGWSSTTVSSHVDKIEILITSIMQLGGSYLVAKTILRQLAYLIKRSKLKTLLKETICTSIFSV